MGSGNSVIDKDQLLEYQELTYFTKKEILHVYKRFMEAVPESEKRSGLFDKTTTVDKQRMLDIPELKVRCEVTKKM